MQDRLEKCKATSSRRACDIVMGMENGREAITLCDAPQVLTAAMLKITQSINFQEKVPRRAHGTKIEVYETYAFHTGSVRTTSGVVKDYRHQCGDRVHDQQLNGLSKA
ncbi:hypothetical protein EVAR_2967_1 [Eumeta japonica]|uniref:Uncharacterized protein n=1 Tax=Eumeta variegata TaxID=151549 RepID=A0A4C1ST75_EUMVA|nr:hypothetical protein EVAR_2967_1 [Eumeta japonica]